MLSPPRDRSETSRPPVKEESEAAEPVAAYDDDVPF
jgi:hypothetical protein